ncbi:hypothetical protein SNE40_009469 [Patella caerulea]|uniref:Thioredoxin domain-containing protein n=1 Tax=Patella caerulea TaxID=87958 RepID=A0AAN8JU68_PATCE
MAKWSGAGFLALCVSLVLIPCQLEANKKRNDLIIKVDDFKDFKKLLKTKTNLLVIYAQSDKSVSKSMTVFQDVANEIRGKGTLALINCGEEKKLCKKLKVSPSTFDIKHFKDGDFNKDYDRKIAIKSMVNFLLDPTGDLPWDEDPTAQDVVHIDTEGGLAKQLKKNKSPHLVMFYAPWCGYCKRLKPDFSAAATEMKGKAVLVGIDVDKPQQMALRQQYNITGFPTIYYFENGKLKFQYGGENNKDGIVSWLKNPSPPKAPEKEAEWSDEESDVVHLTDENFQESLDKQSSALVMFYAPWCGHCKQMKPGYTEAAALLKAENIPGILAAVDATKSRKSAEEHKIKGFPTVKYFVNGKFEYDFNERTKDKIIEFMKDPKEPPPPPPPEPKWEETESDVVHLTDENFKPVLKKKKHALVMFYAPWCGHCKKAKPEYMAAATKLKDDAKVAFTAVDCTTQSGICLAHDVTGYPTFKYFNYGKNSQKYMGGREEPDFINFMKDPLNLGPGTPSKDKEVDNKVEDDSKKQDEVKNQWKELEGYENVHYLSTANFDTFLKEHKSVLIMFYAPWCGHCKKMKPAYVEAATLLKEQNEDGVLAAVDATIDRQLAQRFEVTGFPTLKYFKNGEYAFEGSSRSKDGLVQFMKNPKAPTPPPVEKEWSDEKSEIAHLTDTTFSQFLLENEQVLVMFYAPWCGHCKNMKPAYKSAADILKKDLPTSRLAAVDATKYPKIAKQFEVKGYPTLKYFVKGVEKMTYSAGRTEKAIVDFMKNPKAPPPPPPPEPEWNTIKSGVNHLTDENFGDFIKNHYSVLVMFYAPWCGHCKKAKPEYQAAADKFIKSETKKLAAVDCTKNKDICKKEEVKGYPTIKFYKGGKFKEMFSGSRTKDGFIDFIEKSGSREKDVKEEL